MPSSPHAAGDLPPAEPVRPGLWSLPVPIPRSPLRYVLTYAFEVPGGVVLVDPGSDEVDPPLAQCALAPAGVLEERVAPVDQHVAGLQVRGELADDRDDLLDRTAAWLRDAGAPAAELADLRDASMALRRLVVVAGPDVLLEDGDRPEVPGWQLTAVHTPGHTPGHLCFYEERSELLLSGDHVLPRITANVSVHPQSGGDPLGDYLASLDRLRKYADSQVLPGHEWRFDRLGGRIDEIVAHHEQRLDAVQALVAGGAETVWEVATRLRWSRPWDEIHGFMRRAAVGETQAHLVALERRGRLARASGHPLRWRAPSGPGAAG